MSLPPSGEIPQGAIRFNTDSQKLEFYAQGEWWIMSTDTPNLGRSADTTPGVRGVFMGGHNEPDPSQIWDIIDYVNIASTGNAVDFGNLLAAEQEGNAFSSSTRGFHFGGDPADNEIERITFASLGNAVDAGDLTATSKTGTGLANATRGIAYLANGDTINYYTMASSGNAVDFGNASFSSGSQGMGCASPTRGVFGGVFVSPATVNTLDFITIATLGDSQDFSLSHDGAGSKIENSTGSLNINTVSSEIWFSKGTSEYLARFITDGAVELYHDGTKKAETTSSGITVTGSVTTQDMNMSNLKGTANEVDSTKGSWSIQEGADDLFLINRVNGKKYKFNLTEIS